MPDNTTIYSTGAEACCLSFVQAVLESKILPNRRKWRTNECTVHAIELTYCPFCGSKLPAARRNRQRVVKTQTDLFNGE